MGRELRRVPANWEHPKQDNGNYQPLLNTFYGDVMAEWLKDHNKWLDGTHEDIVDNPERKEEYPFYAMYHGEAPDVDFYQTRRYSDNELTHIQLYETTSEGTPKSPVFKADEFEKLCEYAEEHCTTFARYKATKEEWMKMLGDGIVFHQEGNMIFM